MRITMKSARGSQRPTKPLARPKARLLYRPRGRCAPASGRGRPRRVPRRSRCGSLATLPEVAFRAPPLTPAPTGERLHSMASKGRHHSAVVTGRDLSPQVAVRAGDAPLGRIPLHPPQPGLASTQPRRRGRHAVTGRCKMCIRAHGVLRPPCARISCPAGPPPPSLRNACCVPTPDDWRRLFFAMRLCTISELP